MNMKLILVTLLLIISSQAQSAMLYDSSLGTTPSAQGWFSLNTGGSFGMSSGAYTMDTSSNELFQAGNSRTGLPLNTMTGFSLNLDLRIDTENHSDPNRAGFSFITIGQDPTQAIEVAFWEDRVWVYDYVAGDFVKGVEYEIDTTVRRDYRLEVANHQFELFVDNNLGISGSMVNYSPFGPPYSVPSTLIFGDDTTSGSSSVEIYSIQTVPIPPALLLFAAGFGLLQVTARRKGI